MKVSLNWLRDFVDFELAPEELAEALTMLGLEVESIEYLGGNFDQIVVGRLEVVGPHPDADKLSYCQVDVGGSEKLGIVCGASNIKPGDMVPVALVGAVLPGGMKIKRSKIRGMESHGMLCSSHELGLGDDKSGIYILGDDAPLGGKLAEYLLLADVVLEVGLTPNRGDCLSMLGIAREVSAYCNIPLKKPSIEFSETGPNIDKLAAVEIVDPDLCPRYAARVIKGVAIAVSPLWMQARLRAVGLRPINNVVDVTNYVLMELGHPLHAFDYDLLAEHKIIVKRAAENEKFTTLDEVERELCTDNLLICDAEKGVALAGVMGGQNSEVSQNTTNLLLESAYFKPQNVHRTSKTLQLESESAHRFARGTDYEGMITALNRTAQLILELAGGEAAKGMIDVYPEKIMSPCITIRPKRVNAILGTEIEVDEIKVLLERLHFTTTHSTIDTREIRLQVQVPTYRPDITREIDLIEEVARLYGYGNIPSVQISGLATSSEDEHSLSLRKIRDTINHYGLDEVITYSFIDPLSLKDLNLPADHQLNDTVVLANPLTEKQSVMRTSLMPGILAALRYNEFQQNKQIKIFELGKVFSPVPKSKLPQETLMLAGCMTGNRENDALYSSPRKVDFFDLKAIILALATNLSITTPRFVEKSSEVYYHPGIYSAVVIAEEEVGQIGALHPSLQSKLELSEDVYVFELNLDKFLASPKKAKKYQVFSRYPAINRDLALVVKEEKNVEEITGIIWKYGGKHLEKVELFDIYRGNPIAAGYKSLAFSFGFRSMEGTLTDEEIRSKYEKIVQQLEKQIEAEVRQ